MPTTKELYLKARAFFKANPDKWTKNRMAREDGCMCYAGAMAHFDNPKLPLHNRTLSGPGWKISDKVRDDYGLQRGVVSINDWADNLAEATAKLDKIFGVSE